MHHLVKLGYLLGIIFAVSATTYNVNKQDEQDHIEINENDDDYVEIDEDFDIATNQSLKDMVKQAARIKEFYDQLYKALAQADFQLAKDELGEVNASLAQESMVVWSFFRAFAQILNENDTINTTSEYGFIVEELKEIHDLLSRIEKTLDQMFDKDENHIRLVFYRNERRDRIERLYEALKAFLLDPSGEDMVEFLQHYCRQHRPAFIIYPFLYNRVIGFRQSMMADVQYNLTKFMQWYKIVFGDSATAMLTQQICQATRLELPTRIMLGDLDHSTTRMMDALSWMEEVEESIKTDFNEKALDEDIKRYIDEFKGEKRFKIVPSLFEFLTKKYFFVNWAVVAYDSLLEVSIKGTFKTFNFTDWQLVVHFTNRSYAEQQESATSVLEAIDDMKTCLNGNCSAENIATFISRKMDRAKKSGVVLTVERKPRHGAIQVRNHFVRKITCGKNYIVVYG